jgi:hypothetical protein
MGLQNGLTPNRKVPMNRTTDTPGLSATAQAVPPIIV